MLFGESLVVFLLILNAVITSAAARGISFPCRLPRCRTPSHCIAGFSPATRRHSERVYALHPRNSSCASLSSCGSSPSPLPLRCHHERRSAKDRLPRCRTPSHCITGFSPATRSHELRSATDLQLVARVFVVIPSETNWSEPRICRRCLCQVFSSPRI